MTFLQLLPLLFVLAGLILYTVLAGADLGTGVWQLSTRDQRLRGRVYASIGPVWEANHVWLIFVLTVLWTAYPSVFAAVSITLVVPLFLAAVGLILRGTAYALHGASNGPDDHREIDAVFGLSSVFTPFALGAVVGAIASGRVPPGGGGDQWSSWLNPTSILVGVLAVVLGAYLAAVQLAADAVRVGDERGRGRVPAAGAGQRGARRGGRGRRARGRARRRAAAVRRADPRGRAGRRDRLGAAGSAGPGAGLAAPAGSGPVRGRRRGRRGRRRLGAGPAAGRAARPDRGRGGGADLDPGRGRGRGGRRAGSSCSRRSGCCSVWSCAGGWTGRGRPSPSACGRIGGSGPDCSAGSRWPASSPAPRSPCSAPARPLLATGIVLLLAAAPLGFLAAVPPVPEEIR